MTKFKVKDKVRVRKNLEGGNHYNGLFFNKEMEKYKGQNATVTSILSNDRYYLDIAGDSWHFNGAMLEKSIVKTDDLKFGDILTLRNDERYIYADGTMYGEDNNYNCDGDIVKMNFTDDLKRDSSLREYDIMKTEREGQVIYEREDVREMTVEEISKALGYEVKVVK